MPVQRGHSFIRAIIWIGLFVLLNPSEAQSNTAQISYWCYSVALGEATTAQGERFGFTTYDGASGEPLHDLVGGEWIVGGELKPQTLGGSTYLADYIDMLYSGIMYEYGTFTISISTQDANSNGFPDLLEKSLSANESFEGQATPDWSYMGPPYSNTTVEGSITRSADSSTGSYSGNITSARGSTSFNNATWNLVGGTGTVTYDPGTQSANIQITYSGFGETNQLTGVATITTQSKDQVTLNTFTLSDPVSGVTVTSYTGTLQRSGKYYRGNLQLDDGNRLTSWPDYYDYRVEIYDVNDWDNDGVPDLTDPKPEGAMPWLPLLLDN